MTTMPDSLDTLPYYRFRLYRQQGDVISAHYSQPQTHMRDDCGTTGGPTILFSNPEETWQALRGAEPHPFTQATMNASIEEGTPLWTCLPPVYSQKWALDPTQLDSSSIPVYFDVLDDEPGSCTHRTPSEPAEAVPKHPRKFMYPTQAQARERFGDLKLIEMAAKRGDKTATIYHLAHLNLQGKREHLASVAVSLFPNSPVPSGDKPTTRRNCKISPWDLRETAIEDGTSRQTEEDWIEEDV